VREGKDSVFKTALETRQNSCKVAEGQKKGSYFAAHAEMSIGSTEVGLKPWEGGRAPSLLEPQKRGKEGGYREL